MHLNRRRFLHHSLLASAATLAPRLRAQPAATTLQTPSGALRGSLEDNLQVFRGVPFAQPPVGPLRFRPAQPAKPWTGTRDALHFAPAALQNHEPTLPQSEDCLYLNLWAPSSPGPHPVFVWIHGGGFTGGRSFDPTFDGATFARQGIVCVTLAYRLGIFGFLDLSPLLGPSFAGTANLGLTDILEALRWLQTNLPAFGGDPTRITLGGESAGAKLTDLLLGTPSAHPLFAQAISESGGADRIWPLARATSIAQNFGQLWTADPRRSLAQLHTAPAPLLLDAQQTFLDQPPIHFPLRAEIDGHLIPQSPLDAIRAGSSRGKRLLLGSNRDESALFLGPDPRQDPGPTDLGNLPVDQFTPIADRYRSIYPDLSAPQRRIRSVTAEEYWIPSLRVADAHTQAGGQTFVYRLDRNETAGRYLGYAPHTEDLRFVWDHLTPRESSPETTAFAASVHTAWCAFIRGEAPAAPSLPTWPAYNLTTRPTMLLDTPSSRVENAPAAAEFALWDGLLTH